MKSLTVARSFVVDVAGHLTARGLDGDAVRRRAGIADEPTDGRISGARMAAFWEEAVRVSGDADLGLQASVTFNAGALDIVGYVMLSSRTAADALRRGARLMHLLNDGLEVQLTREPSVTTLSVAVHGDGSDPLWTQRRQVMESVLVGIVHQLRLLTGRTVIPMHVAFVHAAPATGVSTHTALFGVTPVFGAPGDRLVLHNADLDVVLRSANPALLASFESHAEAALAALASDTTLRARVARLIVDRLKGEAPDLAVIARELAMSVRSLQRALRAEGVTYQQVLDDVRREVALRHLAAPDATVAKVAWLVGFQEASAFHRAYKRWTGHSPRRG